MITKINSMGLNGMNAYAVEIEADITRGMPRFDVVGLPDASVKESRDRVSAAMKNCGYEFPVGKITINMAPADIRKVGPIYDLAMLVAMLANTDQLNAKLDTCVFLGELSLSGEVRPINGVLPMIIEAKECGLKTAFVPYENSTEASVVSDITVYPIKHIKELVGFLAGARELKPAAKYSPSVQAEICMPDFAEVKGQYTARRALEIAAAGGHNAILIGSPGAGKSMLAKRIPSILPDMTFEESIETTKIHSVAGLLSKEAPLVVSRPFRSPHHTISPAGLSGGGVIPHPGEISLAHNGVLFLDELPEFSRAAMEILRQPVEDGKVTISRVNATLTYPCKIMLIAAMNPCPCGYFGHPTRKCICSPQRVSQYLTKVSGPLLDRLDLHIEAMPIEYDQISSSEKSESSAEIKKRVNSARAIQTERFRNTDITCNAGLSAAKIQEDCPLSDGAKTMLKDAFERMGLSARAYDRIIKVSRTIADLERAEVISEEHIAEAIQYRSLDRKYWQR